ncbi:MAG: MBL fold metallo-hydrolase [Actinomyces sp.]|jgi:ribonuclease BN (tRNA processing enzyme)|nr:MBL fold metallo-hydrolase [Actinomyces sp.]MCI1663325.1 MBL fold metallo-hydrolase [Actinomyces sp.]
MRLRIVGCTGSMSGPRSAASCYLVQAEGPDPATGATRTWNVALDMGPGAFGQLWTHVDPCDLDAVVFSHGHADHIGDVISLHVHRRWGPGRGLAPIVLAGPEGVLDRVRQIDGVGPEEAYEGEFCERSLVAGRALRIGPLTVTPATAWHSVPGFGVRVEGPSEGDPGRRASLFYTGDTDQCDTITAGARGADVLLAECGFTEQETVRGIHMTGARVGETARLAGVGRVLLTHIQPWTDPAVPVAEARTTWPGPLGVVHAGEIHTI